MKLYEDVGALAVLALKAAFMAGIIILLILVMITFMLIQAVYWLKDCSNRIIERLRRWYNG